MTWARAGKIGFSSSGVIRPDQALAALAQPDRALVAQYVERGEDGLAGGRGDARLPVQDAADSRFADPRLGCDVGKPCGHRTGLYRSASRLAHRTGRRGAGRLIGPLPGCCVIALPRVLVGSASRACAARKGWLLQGADGR